MSDAIFDQVQALYPRATLVRVADLQSELGRCDAFLESLTAAELGERDVHNFVCGNGAPPHAF